MTTLLLDMGNTRWKWMPADADDAAVQQSTYADQPVAGMLAELERNGLPERLIIASVRRDALNQSLQAALEARHCDVRFLDWRDCSRLRTQYESPAQLGIDRYLNMIGALHKYRPPLVVASAGTAVTVDAVDESGTHLGGVIFPGRRLLLEALTARADRINFTQPARAGTVLATSTDAGVLAGTERGLTAAVAAFVTDMRGLLGADIPVILTGGDAPLLEKCLPGGSPQVDSTLLFTGMRIVTGNP